jgi:hypothetical protein
MLFQPAFGQNELDLKEAEARDNAKNFMAEAEGQFECKFEEHEMREIGVSSANRYLLRIRAEGDECDDAMIFLTNISARDNKLIFRQVESPDQQEEEPMILFGQVLIHEINPEPEDDKTTEN